MDEDRMDGYLLICEVSLTLARLVPDASTGTVTLCRADAGPVALPADAPIARLLALLRVGATASAAPPAAGSPRPRLAPGR